MLNRDTVLTIGSVIAFPPVSVQYSGIQTSWIKNGCFVFHQPSKRQRRGTKLWVNLEQLIRQRVLMHSLSDMDFSFEWLYASQSGPQGALCCAIFQARDMSPCSIYSPNFNKCQQRFTILIHAILIQISLTYRRWSWIGKDLACQEVKQKGKRLLSVTSEAKRERLVSAADTELAILCHERSRHWWSMPQWFVVLLN